MSYKLEQAVKFCIMIKSDIWEQLFVTLIYHQFFTDLALSYLNQGFQGQFDTRLRFLIQQTSMNWYSF